MPANQNGGDDPDFKIEALARRYEREDLLEEMVIKYQGESEEDSYSVRELTTWFNAEIIDAQLREQGVSGPSSNRIELYFQDQLDREEASSIETLLEERGIDPESLDEERISHSTMYRYLRGETNADTSIEERTPDKVRRSMTKLHVQTRNVVARAIEMMGRNGHVQISSPIVSVDIRVECSDCGASYRLSRNSEFWDVLACDCEPKQSPTQTQTVSSDESTAGSDAN